MEKLGVWVTVQVLQEPSDSPVTGFPHLSPQITWLSGIAPSPPFPPIKSQQEL